MQLHRGLFYTKNMWNFLYDFRNLFPLTVFVKNKEKQNSFSVADHKESGGKPWPDPNKISNVIKFRFQTSGSFSHMWTFNLVFLLSIFSFNTFNDEQDDQKTEVLYMQVKRREKEKVASHLSMSPHVVLGGKHLPTVRTLDVPVPWSMHVFVMFVKIRLVVGFVVTQFTFESFWFIREVRVVVHLTMVEKEKRNIEYVMSWQRNNFVKSLEKYVISTLSKLKIGMKGQS